MDLEYCFVQRYQTPIYISMMLDESITLMNAVMSHKNTNSLRLNLSFYSIAIILYLSSLSDLNLLAISIKRLDLG